MPLPEHEQRQLQQIEQALCRDDPKFVRLVRVGDPRVHYKRKLLQALPGVVIGADLLAAGAVTGRACLEAPGVVIVLLFPGVDRGQLAATRGQGPAPAFRGGEPRRRRTRSTGPGRPGGHG